MTMQCAAGHMGPALQGIFVGQGLRALPGVRGKTGRRGESTPPLRVRGKECLRRDDVGIVPYGGRITLFIHVQDK